MKLSHILESIPCQQPIQEGQVKESSTVHVDVYHLEVTAEEQEKVEDVGRVTSGGLLLVILLTGLGLVIVQRDIQMFQF